MIIPPNTTLKLMKEKNRLLRVKKYYEKEEEKHQLLPKEEKLLKIINDMLKSYFKGK